MCHSSQEVINLVFTVLRWCQWVLPRKRYVQQVSTVPDKKQPSDPAIPSQHDQPNLYWMPRNTLCKTKEERSTYTPRAYHTEPIRLGMPAGQERKVPERAVRQVMVITVNIQFMGYSLPSPNTPVSAYLECPMCTHRQSLHSMALLSQPCYGRSSWLTYFTF